MRVWWWTRPLAHRGALVAIHVDGKLLLIRNSYRHGWTFPGGGVEPGETSLAAATRELREELGLAIVIAGAPTVVTGRWEGRPDTVDIFDVVLTAAPALHLDYREVIDAQFFPPSELASLMLTGAVAAYVALRCPSPHDEHLGT